MMTANQGADETMSTNTTGDQENTVNVDDANHDCNVEARDAAVAASDADERLSAIDAAIAAAQAAGNVPAARNPGREENKQQLVEDRERRRQEREAKRTAAAPKPPAHMKKVSKAAERLGSLGTTAQLLLNEAVVNLTTAELLELANHLMHRVRASSTTSALENKLTTGQRVRIARGAQARFIGQEGVVTKAGRIRVHVQVAGIAGGRDLYLYSSDVNPIAVSEEEEKGNSAGPAEQETAAA